MSARGSSDRFRLIEFVYQRAADLPRRARRVLCAECGDDETIRAEIETLLEHYQFASPSFLEAPICDLSHGASPAALLPTRIGGYQVVRLIGEGGMGTVFEASQEHPRRSVAVKLIRPGIASAGSLRRFELEAEILAASNIPTSRTYTKPVSRRSRFRAARRRDNRSSQRGPRPQPI